MLENSDRLLTRQKLESHFGSPLPQLPRSSESWFISPFDRRFDDVVPPSFPVFPSLPRQDTLCAQIEVNHSRHSSQKGGRKKGEKEGNKAPHLTTAPPTERPSLTHSSEDPLISALSPLLCSLLSLSFLSRTLARSLSNPSFPLASNHQWFRRPFWQHILKLQRARLYFSLGR